MIYYIYKITVGDFLYIGSTMQTPPQKRWWDHQSNMNNPKCHMHNYPLYTKMREVGIDKCEFIILRNIDITTELEAKLEEQIEINKYGLDNLLNDRGAYLSRSDRLKNERNRINEKRKQLISEDREGYLKLEREKRNNARANLKAKDPEAYLQKQRDYLAKKKNKVI